MDNNFIVTVEVTCRLPVVDFKCIEGRFVWKLKLNVRWSIVFIDEWLSKDAFISYF